jgi:glycosyltransferase involved in cell wall biosynthesis
MPTDDSAAGSTRRGPARLDLSGRRVLVLNWRDVHHPEAGGSEVYVDNVARGLVARGATVTMVCPRYPGAPRREVLHGLEHRRFAGRLSIYLIVPLLLLIRRLPRPDLVVEVQNGVPFLAAAYARCPVVVLVHHVHREQWPILFSPALARLGWWLESSLAPRVARHAPYVTVSRATHDELVDLGVDAKRITIVHNGSPDRGDLVDSGRDPQPLVLALGRLVPHKRIEVAIEAVAELADEIPGLRLAVVGEGWWHSHLVARATDLGVLDRVEFTGHVSDDEKHLWLSRAWVNVLPSVKEGWGLVVVEAGMHQTPTVAFASAGGVTESVVDGVTGLLVDTQAELVAGLRSLLTDETLRLRLGIAADKHARSFTWSDAEQGFAEVVGAALDPA